MQLIREATMSKLVSVLLLAATVIVSNSACAANAVGQVTQLSCIMVAKRADDSTKFF